MADTVLKMRVLWAWLVNTYSEWRKEVWAKDLDQQYCCDGRECGCGGGTVRDNYCWGLSRETDQ